MGFPGWQRMGTIMRTRAPCPAATKRPANGIPTPVSRRRRETASFPCSLSPLLPPSTRVTKTHASVNWIKLGQNKRRRTRQSKQRAFRFKLRTLERTSTLSRRGSGTHARCLKHGTKPTNNYTLSSLMSEVSASGVGPDAQMYGAHISCWLFVRFPHPYTGPGRR